MERKLSKFAVGDQITTHGKVKNWAIGNDKKLITEKVFSITENHNGIEYKTHECNCIKEELVIDPKDAKKIALKFLAECMIVIAGKEEPCH